jgi:HEAT repeat protein
VIAVLADALKAGPSSIRSTAAEALGRFGPQAASSAPRLRELLEARDSHVRDAAEAALKAIAPPPATPAAKGP